MRGTQNGFCRSFWREFVDGDGDVGGPVEREAALVAAGQVGLVGEDGTGVLGAAAAGEGGGQLDFEMDQERAGGGEEQGAGGFGCSMAPPPRARTRLSAATRRAMVACSRSRKAASPWRAKISVMGMPASASITSSASMKLQPRRAATSGPTVVLPEPMKPVRTMRRGGLAGTGLVAVLVLGGAQSWQLFSGARTSNSDSSIGKRRGACVACQPRP